MKNILATILVLASAQSYAVCSTKSFAVDQNIPGSIPTDISGYNEYNITNQTGSTQNYQVCIELSTQFFDHTHKFTTAFCEPVTLASGQSTGSVRRDPVVRVQYERVSGGAYYVNLDSITEIKGECHSLSHIIKKVKVR